MQEHTPERRKYKRYPTDAKVYFSVSYSLDVPMKFQVLDKDTHTLVSHDKHLAFGRDISLEGFSFTSDLQLQKGDRISLELYVPERKEPIHMEGEVRWSQRVYSEHKYENKFSTGLRLLTVEGKSVLESIHYDGANRVMWSAVLDYAFGSYRHLVQKQQKLKADGESSDKPPEEKK